MERFTLPQDADEKERVTVDVSAETAYTIHVKGELDFYNRSKLMTVIESAFSQGHKQFALDLSNVSFMDSSGLSSLVLTKRLIENRGGIMPCIFSEVVKRIINLSGLDKFFAKFDNLNDAQQALRSHSV